MSIAAVVLARNSAQTIRRTLHSVRPHVDRVHVYLAGPSADGTPELLHALAREPGPPLHVAQGEWHQDMARARNQAAALADASRLVWLDDDETLHGGHLLRQLDGDAVYLRRVNERADGSVSFAWEPRILTAGRYRWSYPVHATLEPAIAADPRCRRDVADPACLHIVHRQPPGRVHDHRAAVEQLHAADPSPHSAFYLGRHLLLDDHDPAAAVPLFAQAAVGVSLEAAAAHRWLAHAHAQLGDQDATLAALNRHAESLAAWQADPIHARIAATEDRLAAEPETAAA